MTKIIIKDIELFHRYLSAICKLVDSCKFIISKNKCLVMSVDDAKTFRVFFETDCVVCPTGTEFCIGSLNKLNNSISALKEFKEGNNTAELEFDGGALKLKDIVKFNLKCIKEEVIKSLIGQPITAKLEPVYGFKLHNALSRKLCQMSFISTQDENHRVYFYIDDGKVIGEIDNKNQTIRDSIAIPVSTDYKGEWSTPIITKLDQFRMWNLLNADEININVVKQGPVAISSQVDSNGYKIAVKMLAMPLKK